MSSAVVQENQGAAEVRLRSDDEGIVGDKGSQQSVEEGASEQRRCRGEVMVEATGCGGAGRCSGGAAEHEGRTAPVVGRELLLTEY